MVGNVILRQEHAEQVFDLTQADAHGTGGGGQLSLLGLVEKNPEFGLAFQPGDRLAEMLILGAEFSRDLIGGRVGEALLDLASVLINRLAAALRFLGLLSHRAVLSGENGGGVADPSADR